MNVQLLLLLALAGPFCAFTHASPTAITTDGPVHTTESGTFAQTTAAAGVADATTDVPDMDHTLVTGPPTTAPETAPERVTTEPTVPAAAPEVTETDAPVHASTVAPQPRITFPPAVETAAPTVPATAEDQTEVTGAPETDIGGEVVVEGDTVDGLSSGQVVGIVIGALLAVVIVIAVVIAVVRRMGKYSSAKNKKPAKKDSAMVSPLRRKSAKQQERSKFWKF